jgi:L-fuconolactonase
MARIDSHQHFWTFVPEHYPWIGHDMAALRRDFGPADLQPELDAAGVEGTVLVEARAHLDETNKLLDFADSVAFVRGVVGWLPLTEPGVEALVERYAERPALRGLRHWVGPADDTDSMFAPALNRGIALLQPAGLAFDLMLWPPQLDNISRFVDAHPKQTFILDHFAKPFIVTGAIDDWARHLRELAKRSNVYCKVSGLATEADPNRWTTADLLPYLETALDAFGPARLMFGSDWPVCTLATPYGRWAQTVGNWITSLSPAEKARILGDTAIEAYGLS